MPLPPRQITVLRYLSDRPSATTRKVSKDLLMNRDDAQNALQGLTSRHLVSADHGTLPVSWSITDMGAAVVAAANERDDR
jgi:DNA-binding IclR family transcriptional regulator